MIRRPPSSPLFPYTPLSGSVHLVGLGLEPLEEAAHAVPGAGPGLAPALPFRLAFEHPVLLKGIQLVKREVQGNPALLRVLLQRSEEHTSELQSQSNLVCRLL